MSKNHARGTFVPGGSGATVTHTPVLRHAGRNHTPYAPIVHRRARKLILSVQKRNNNATRHRRKQKMKVRHKMAQLPAFFNDQGSVANSSMRTPPTFQQRQHMMSPATQFAAVAAALSRKKKQGPSITAFINNPQRYVYDHEYVMTKRSLNNVALKSPLTPAEYAKAELVVPAQRAPRQQQVPIIVQRRNNLPYNVGGTAENMSFSRKKSSGGYKNI